MSARFTLLLALVSFGCSDPVVTAPPPAKAQAPAPQVVAGAASAATAAASGSASASAAPPPKVEIQETEFTESERSRDPFRSFANSFAADAKTSVKPQVHVILDQYALDELKLIGIVTRAEPAKAMLVDPTGKGFVVQRGQFVGRPETVQAAGASGSVYEVNWRVDRIRPGDVVLVREDPSNPDVPTATRVIPLRPDEDLDATGEAKKK